LRRGEADAAISVKSRAHVPDRTCFVGFTFRQ
jgi:hypothetical protein